MTEKFICEECEKEFGSQEALEQHNQAKHPEKIKQPLISNRKKSKIKNWSIIIIVFVFGFGAIFFMVSNIKTLPPTSIEGHAEENPPSHIMKTPMRISVQKHMLEHTDGFGPPGVVINYNCIGYTCKENLVEKLEQFAKNYTYVYVAQFSNMDAKIALTKLNKMEILEEYNYEKIKAFIE